MRKCIVYFAFFIVLLAVVSPLGILSQDIPNNQKVEITIDGAVRYQQIDGIGVNANTSSWNGDDLKPALDLLVDSMHMSLWRVVVESVEKWEDVNDNGDPFTFNWEYYNNLYETTKFRKVWEMVHYLNQRGITNNLMINFMGFAPKWMGNKVIEPRYEQEFVEMIVSFFFYAIKVKNLKIGLIGPTNESDWYNYSEGPHLNGPQLARIIRMMIDRMEALGIMGNIKIVAPDVVVFENATNSFIPALMNDPVVWSKIAHLGFHSYGGYSYDIQGYIKSSPHPSMTYWMTEFNAWCDGCDSGKIGIYNYPYASKSVKFLLEFLANGATGCLIWEGYDSYYEHHAPSPFSWWGVLGYDKDTKRYTPRKHYYAFSQVSRFVPPGSYRISVSQQGDSLTILAFYDAVSQRVSLVGINSGRTPVNLVGNMHNLPDISNFELIYTSHEKNLYKAGIVKVTKQSFGAVIPGDCIFTLTGTGSNNKIFPIAKVKPEPNGWYAGDMHVHRNCGDATGIVDDSKLEDMMAANDLAVISVLADMGNGEVKDAKADLLKVTGQDVQQTSGGRTIHWDAEWHWDASYSNFEHQALGGHLVFLGLKEAHQIWDERPYKVLEWAKKQNAVSGFCHLQYLNDSIQNELNCCIPIEYPVEAALETIDFVSEDVLGTLSANPGIYNADATINAYYKLLNCGFRLSLAAGTDYPCNNGEPFGTLLTYVKVDGPFTYDKWVEGIKKGRTVVARNGHQEFIDMRVNGNSQPGDDIRIKDKGTVSVNVNWTTGEQATGRLELVCNGKVIAAKEGTARPGEPVILKATHEFIKSGWICARRMNDRGHQTHTAPVFITVNNAPVRTGAKNAQYFVEWIDNLLEKTSPGREWNRYYTHNLDEVQARYKKAKDIYSKIAEEARLADAMNLETHQ